jgi:hypothetical protein
LVQRRALSWTFSLTREAAMNVSKSPSRLSAHTVEQLLKALDALARVLTPTQPAVLVRQAFAHDGKGRITDFYQTSEPVYVIDPAGRDDVFEETFLTPGPQGRPISLRLKRR